MLIKISQDISRLEYFAQGEEIPKVTGGKAEGKKREKLIQAFVYPRLLVDNAAIGKLSAVKRDAVMRLLEFGGREVEYDGVNIFWSDAQYPNVWAPSIDTIVFARALRMLFKRKGCLNDTSSFLEIGCGSGYLAKYILQKKREANSPLRHAHLMDIYRDALLCAMDAIDEVRGNTLVSYSLNRPQKRINVAHKYDLVLCNPPYVPRPNANPNNPFEGLFLYGEILKRVDEMMHDKSRLVINFSSLSKKDVFAEYSKKFRIEIIDKMKVPLKIPLITAGYSPESRQWMEYLLKNKRFIEDKTEKSGHRYWQIIEIAECQLKVKSL